MNLSDKTIVITGAGSGIGRELTLQLVDRGARVAMIDIHEDALAETASLTDESQVSAHTANIALRQEVEKLPQSIIEHHGSVDGLINNAGIIQPFVDVQSLDYEDVERIMDINFYGTLYMVKSFLPVLLERPEAHIANVSSMGGFIPFPGQTLYGASKAAVKLLTEGLYAELKGTKVGVSVILPGAVNTNIMSNSGVERMSADSASEDQQKNRALPASQAAATIIRGIEKNKFRILVGRDARMLDTLYRLSPRRAVEFIVKQMGGR